MLPVLVLKLMLPAQFVDLTGDRILKAGEHSSIRIRGRFVGSKGKETVS